MRRFLPVLLLPLLACGPFFFQAPPPLSQYPERLAAKPWLEIFQEISPADENYRKAEALDEAVRGLVHQLAWLEPEGRMVAIDRALEANRSGEYAARRANFLHELRELAAEESMFKHAEAYLAWRMTQDRPMPPAPPRNKPWDMEEEHFKNLHVVHEMRLAERLEPLDAGVAAGDERLLPNWLVQRGGFYFSQSRFEEAEADFQVVLDRFPTHPRAEAAGIMMARCHLENARAIRRNAVPRDEGAALRISMLLNECERVLHRMIAEKPEGRFTPDAHGWLGAVACDRGNLGLAMKHQWDRMEMQPTREITRTVLREFDFLFSRLFERLADGDELPESDGYYDADALFHADVVARHPALARLFVHHALDPAAGIHLPLMGENYSGDRGTIRFLNRRILKPKPFVKVALAELGRHLLAGPGGEDPVTLLILAWASTEEGEHDQALALLEKIPGEPNDEVLHARGVILQRLKRHADAAAAFAALEEAFPQSSLRADVGYRRAVCLFHAGRAGEAWLLLAGLNREMIEPPEEAALPNLQPDHQYVQWLDTIGRFAPLDELVKSRESLADGHPWSVELDHLIRLRAIAARDFPLARKHLFTGEVAPELEWRRGRYDLFRALFQTETVWNERVAPLAGLYERLAKAPSGERHMLHLDIARHWMEHRGHLTLPILGVEDYSNSEPEKIDLLRRKNARDLGFPAEHIHRELDFADEASHALEHALAAAESPEPGIAAAALELANHCLFRRAEFSRYQRMRAVETNAAALSKDIHRRLTGRFPESAEARRALWCDFQPYTGTWMPGDYNASNAHAAMLEALAGQAADPEAEEKARAEISGLVHGFENPEPGVSLAVTRRQLDAARNRLDKLRALVGPEDQAEILSVVDRLDDLAAAASLPGITIGDFTNYANHRTEKLPPSFASLLDFRRRLEPGIDANGWEAGPRDDSVRGWRDFLDAYPDSPKAEAASFRMTRLIARKYRSRLLVGAFDFPEAPIPNGYKRVCVYRDDPTVDLEEVFSAIAAHESAYPVGRYQDDLDLLRAGALIDAGKPVEALAILHRILSSRVQGDLHGVAVLCFAEIAQGLLEPSTRLAALEAFQGTPRALVWLERLVAGDTYLTRLQPMMPSIRGHLRK